MRKSPILVLAIILSVSVAFSINCGGSGGGTKIVYPSTNTGTGTTGTGTGTDTGTGTGTGTTTSTNTLRVELGPNNPGGKMTWQLPDTGTFDCCLLQFRFEAIGGNVSVISMVVTDTGDGSLTNGIAMKCNVWEDIGDCAGKWDPSDVRVANDVAWDDTRTVTITFTTPIKLENLVRRTFIICYKVICPNYSLDPLYYQAVIPVDQIDAVETGGSLKVPTDPPSGNITGQQTLFAPI